MREYTKTAMTVGDLREFVKDPTTPDNAYLWVLNDKSEGFLVTGISLDQICAPDKGYPQEVGLCLQLEEGV